MLITNDSGRHARLNPRDFKMLVDGKIKWGSALWEKLGAKGFIRECMDFDALSGDFCRMNRVTLNGPSLHILIMTLRCNHKCIYCHSSAVLFDRMDTDMSLETARSAVDFIFQSPNDSICIEFQGGEPLLNWPVVRFAARYAREKNRAENRDLIVSLVSNLTLMDKEKFRFLLENGISICTSLDGPEFIHNRNRLYLGGNSHDLTVFWLKKYLSQIERRKGKERDFIPGALMTATRFSLPHPRMIVDEYVDLGLQDIFIRPLSPIGYAKTVWGKIGYGTEEFLEFYRRAMDYILELNSGGVRFVERTAAVILRKILKGEDPGFLDLRSPCGAVVGQLAYNYDGGIFTCDEGRMVAHQGDDAFKLGSVFSNSYADVLQSPVTKTCMISSLLDGQPLCARCAFKPYCGVCPVHNYEVQGTPFGRMPENDWCAVQKGIFRYLFQKVYHPKWGPVLKSWLD